jgi:hypothetical protein
MKIIIVLLLVLAFASGVVVGERRTMRIHNEQVQVLHEQMQVLRGESQSWQAHHLGVPVASLMTAD